MPELSLRPNLEDELRAAYSRNIDAGLITPATTQGLGEAATAAAQQNRAERGETDAFVSNFTPEQEATAEDLRAQLSTAITGYDGVVMGMELPHADRVDSLDINLLFEDELKVWAANGTLDYIREQQESDPENTFTLIASPNLTVHKLSIFKAAHAFAKGQDDWDEAYIYQALYDEYSHSELSGSPLAVGDDMPNVRFTLIPAKYTEGVPKDLGVGAQVEAFGQYVENETTGRMRPDMRLRIPSVTDAITWWYTMRTKQRETSGDFNKQLEVDSFNDTFLRHIDLPEKEISGSRLVPESFVDAGGQPRLHNSHVDNADGVRVAVG